MGADHTLCMVCMVCTHHPNHTFVTVTTPCRWHVNRKRGRREGKKRERRGSLLLPSITHPAGTHHPSSPLLPLFPPSHLSSTPTTHTHTITSTDLAYNHHYITAPPTQPASPHTHTHTHTNPKPHPMHVPVHRGNAAAAAAPHYSCSSPSSPAAHVLLHLHVTPVNTSSKWYMCE